MWGERGPRSDSCEEAAELRSAWRHGAEGSLASSQEGVTVKVVLKEIEADISTSRLGWDWEPARSSP